MNPRFIYVFCPILLSFSLQAQPVVQSFSPLSGRIGSIVTISGQNFGATPQDNIVYFGPVKAIVQSASPTSLTVQVPAGTVYSPVKVITGGGVASSNASFSVIFPDGDSAFTAYGFKRQYYGPPGNSDLNLALIRAEDMNNDGKPELLMQKRNGRHNVSIMPNTSSPGSIAFTGFVDVDMISAAHVFCVEDLDGDARRDIVGANVDENHLMVARNIATGNEISFAPPMRLENSGSTYALSTADFDSDGKPEIITGSFNGNPIVTVFRNQSTAGTISFAPAQVIPAGYQSTGMAIRDYDGDGKLDIAVSAVMNGRLNILRNTSTVGSISFAAPVSYESGMGPWDVVSADLDNDGKYDLIVPNRESTNITVFKNNSTPGTMSFAEPITLYASGSPQLVRTGDLNGDGKVDIACLDQRKRILVYKNTSEAGQLQFDSLASYVANDDLNMSFSSGLLLADLDGDGRGDMVTGSWSSYATVSIFRNTICDPAISGFSPLIAFKDSLLTINGRNLSQTYTVELGNTHVASFNIQSSTEIKAIVGNGSTGFVSVTTPYGTASSASQFIYSGPPVITSFFPIIVGKNSSLSVQGLYFDGVLSVTLGGVPAKSFSVVGPQLINVVAGDGASGNVEVRTPRGVATKSGLIYIQKPEIYSFDPQAAGTGDSVTIFGQHLKYISNVRFGVFFASGIKVFSDTVIKAVVGSFSSGDIIASSVGGADTISGFIHTGPVILSRCPGSTSTLPAGRIGSTYSWQVNKGSGFQPIADTGIYSGTNTSSLTLTVTPSEYYGYTYRCLVDGQSGTNFIIKFRNSWMGTFSASWENLGNWTCAAIPDANSDVVISTGNVVISSNVIVRSLSLGTGATLTVSPGYTLTITH